MDERKIIEENLAKKNCNAAIYDCSYYLFIHEELPGDSFRSEILEELRTILTGDSDFGLEFAYRNLLTEIYEFKIDFNREENFKVLDLNIFSTFLRLEF